MTRRASAGREKVLGVDYPNTLMSVNGLALLLSASIHDHHQALDLDRVEGVTRNLQDVTRGSVINIAYSAIIQFCGTFSSINISVYQSDTDEPQMQAVLISKLLVSRKRLLPLLFHFLKLSRFDVIYETMKLNRCIFGGEVWRLRKILHVIFNSLLKAIMTCQWIKYQTKRRCCGID